VATLSVRRPTGDRDHFVVCGDTPLAYRLVDQLSREHGREVTAIVPSKKLNHGARLVLLAKGQSRIRIIEAAELDDDTFRSAHVEGARAVALVGPGAVGNIHAALRCQELNPDVRLVIRMSNTNLGHRIQSLFNDCAVLSDAAMAAPSFVAAALSEEGERTPSHVRVAGRTLYVADRRDAGTKRVVCGLADTRLSESKPRLLPLDQENANLVLAIADGTPTDALSRHRKRRRRFGTMTNTLRATVNKRLLAASITLSIMLVAATVIFAISARDAGYGGGWGNAIYLTFLDAAGAANADTGAGHMLFKVTQVILTLLAIVLPPLLTATIVDAGVRARLGGADVLLREPISGHVVVVGLGEVGLRIVAQLHDLGIPVVCVEHNENAVGVNLARRLNVPIVFGDGTREDTLRTAWVAYSRAVVTATHDDVANLEAALNAKALRDNVRIVLRLFDDDLARRVHTTFKIAVSRSVSYLAAPAFVAAMLDRQVIGTIPVGRRAMLIADIPVLTGSSLEGRPLNDAHIPGEARVIALGRRGNPRTDWDFAGDDPLVTGDRIVVLATRVGLAGILNRANVPQPRAPS
jgi:Trk K+ transport system NAD-binding subunit